MTKPHYHTYKILKPRFKYWRLTQLIIALALTLVLLFCVIQVSNQSDNLAQEKVSRLIETKINLIAAPAQLMLQQTLSKRKRQRAIAKQQLGALSETLTKQADIVKVSFYNRYGKAATQLDENLALTQFLPIGADNINPPLQNGHELHIQALYGKQQELIGFVELVLNRYQLTGKYKTNKRKNQQLMRIIILSTLFIGIFLTKAFSRKHKFSKFDKKKIRP